MVDGIIYADCELLGVNVIYRMLPLYAVRNRSQYLQKDFFRTPTYALKRK